MPRLADAPSRRRRDRRLDERADPEADAGLAAVAGRVFRNRYAEPVERPRPWLYRQCCGRWILLLVLVRLRRGRRPVDVRVRRRLPRVGASRPALTVVRSALGVRRGRKPTVAAKASRALASCDEFYFRATGALRRERLATEITALCARLLGVAVVSDRAR